jgi:adenylate kinase family enzyme
MEYLEKNYRGYIPIKDALDALNNRDTKSLLPTELVLMLVKREIDKMPKKTLFIDGFPRELDQVSYSLFFRDLIDYREDPDIFIAISIPEAVIDERMRYRRVCPKCQTPRNLKLFTTKKAGYDKEKKEFYLKCDNRECNQARMIAKEGDNLGIEAIKERLELDDRLIERIFSLHGIPKILLRNSLPVKESKELVDDYEITPEYVYELERSGKVKVKEKSWVIKDDDGQDAYSLLAPPVTVSLIKQLASILVK